MNELDQLKAENAKLKMQLGKVLEAMGDGDTDICCPSNVCLPEHCDRGNCRECWKQALDEVEEVKPRKH